MMDLKKAYQAIYTSPAELHLRRFFYRGDPREEWETFGYTRATFGDITAGLLLEIAKRKVANLGEDINPQAATQLKDFFYVDDGILGGTKEDVDRMGGERVDGVYTGTAAQILPRGVMTIKFMAVTGSWDEYEEEQLGGKNLGVTYDIRRDEIILAIQPCYYSSRKGCSDEVKEIIVLDSQDVRDITEGSQELSRQNLLSMVMGVYDPLGLASAALLKGNIMLRRLYTINQTC